MLFWMTAAAALLGDVVSKMLAARLLGQGKWSLWPLAECYLTRNTGMAFGMLAGKLAANVLLPLAAMTCGWMLMRKYRLTRFTSIACGLIVGGFVGNFGQRLLQGYVLDMIFLPWLPWFVCNVADICICFGVALLAGSLLWRPADWMEKEECTHAKDGE